MRLIDADELLKRIAHHTVHDSLKRITFEAANTYEQVKGDMFNLVQKAPTIDAEPMRHGRWIKDDYYNCWYCSECGAVVRHNCFDYCNCGAKMDGGVDNA